MIGLLFSGATTIDQNDMWLSIVIQEMSIISGQNNANLGFHDFCVYQIKLQECQICEVNIYEQIVWLEKFWH